MIIFSIRLSADHQELNVRRSYLIEAGEDLFGSWIVEINYGRIGCKGRNKKFLMESEEDAKTEVKRRLRKRERLVKKLGVGYAVKSIYGGQWLEPSNPE
jgi:predicted DNA-binding WGR domain protein